MSTVFTPNLTDNVTVLAPYAVIKGEAYRTTTGLDLRTKLGGMLYLAIACGGSTGLTAGSALNVRVYRCLNNDGVNPILGAPYAAYSQTVVGKALINGAVAAGVTSIAYDGAGGTAFAMDQQLCIWGTDTIPTASGAISVNHGVEWLKCGKGAATPVLFGTPTKVDHHDNEVITIGSAWCIPLEGMSAYAVEFDHLMDAAGEAMACAAYVQTFDSMTGT